MASKARELARAVRNIRSTAKYTANGTAVVFAAPTNYTAGYVDVFYNGAKLIVDSDYTANTTNTVTLSVAPPNGTTIEIVTYGVSGYFDQSFSNTVVFNSDLAFNNTHITANGNVGGYGQVLTSGGPTGNVYWANGGGGGGAAQAYSNAVTDTQNWALGWFANTTNPTFQDASVYGTLTIRTLHANGSIGANGQVLTSNGTTTYWANAASGGGGGSSVNIVDSVTSVSIVDAASANSVKRAYDTAVAANDGILIAYANAVTYAIDTANTAYTNAVSYTNTKAAAAYTNATSYANTAAATAYSNAVSFAANASNITTGTLSNARLSTANTSTAGVVQLVDSTTNTSIVLAATANSVATAYGAALAANTLAASKLSTVGGTLNGDLVVTGNLTIQGTSVTLSSVSLSTTDNILYLNEAETTSVTGASGNGTVITYTANNIFVVGGVVRVTGITPTGFNTSGYVAVTSANSTTFSVSNTFTGTYTSGGTATFKTAINPDVGFAAGYNDGTYHHAGFFRDASDGVWKVFDNYAPEPSDVYIDTSNTTFHLADFAANNILANGNLIVTGTITGTASSANNTTYLNGQLASYYTGRDDTAYSNAVSTAATDATSKAATAYANAVSYANSTFTKTSDVYVRSGAVGSVAAGWLIDAFRNGAGSSPNIYMSHGSGYGMHINTYNTSGSIYALQLHNNTKELLGVYNDGHAALGGDFTATGNITAYYSDARLKNFEGKIDNALGRVHKLNGYYYKGNDVAGALGYDTEKLQVGVSAQEAQEALPEVVAPAPIDNQYLTVHYDKFAPLLIEAIKEVDNKYQSYIAKLEARIAQLEGK